MTRCRAFQGGNGLIKPSTLSVETSNDLLYVHFLLPRHDLRDLMGDNHNS